ncbi:biotin transporter BioY [Nocardioides jishulii]|uniref:Biotin transporter n=1 Tax=Nocardioides jishulii TaxID=2575440 RepID=A0A4U2YLS5_9ACTN|nr:biotin transporter BioY [Nocardioides jishulii]TKI61870.1 biotin transporter BioY [Nocardioides jishulii]
MGRSRSPGRRPSKGTRVSTHSLRLESRDLALVTTFAALIAVCAVLPAVQTGGAVPITLQTFGVLLTGALLGPWRGFLAVGLYLLVGIAGLPVFTQGRSGPSVFLTPSAGYLVGFLLAAAVAGFLVQYVRRRRSALGFALVLGACLVATFLVIHPLGIAGMVWRAEMTWTAATAYNATFIPGDLVKAFVTAVVATSVHAAFPDLLPTPRRRTVARRETIDA